MSITEIKELDNRKTNSTLPLVMFYQFTLRSGACLPAYGCFSIQKMSPTYLKLNRSNAVSCVASLCWWIVCVYIQPSNLKVKLISLVLISPFRGISQRDIISIIDRSTLANNDCQFLCNSSPSMDWTATMLSCYWRDFRTEMWHFWKGAGTKLSKFFIKLPAGLRAMKKVVG